ncbi:MAG: hypothetical protein J6S63_06750 [Atopobiaceae bacterium]|nr:hypothetical protein [Atopobiaceae bacterium]
MEENVIPEEFPDEFQTELLELVNLAYEAGGKMGIAREAQQNADQRTKGFLEKFGPMVGKERDE